MRRGVSQSALTERERMAFVEHIARLEQRLAEVERELARGPKPPPVRSAPVLKAPEPDPTPVPRRRLVFPKHSVHKPGQGLGRLSFNATLNAHVPGVTTQEVAEAAGVTCPSVSRWRIANRLTAVWVLPAEIPSGWRQDAPGSTIDPDPIKGAAEGSQGPGSPALQASAAHT